MIQRSFIKRYGYDLIRIVMRLTFVAFFRFRCEGRDQFPRDGGALVCSNHQSFFDPMMVGLTCDRRLNYLARQTLFRFTVLRWLLQFLDAIPIDRDGSGLGGLKETLKRLKHQEMVLIFPEGTRTLDGEVAPFKPGFVAVARRGRVPLVPIGIDGAFDAWPKNAVLPRPSAIHVCIGPPVTVDEMARLTDEELVAELERRIRACHARARRGRAD